MSSWFDLHFEKATLWRDEAKALRAILLDCGLTEELKWHQSCYTHDGHHIAILQRLKPFLALAFFRGALMDDPTLKQAFFALTPGRQRGYALYCAGAKQSQTRSNRIAKYRERIIDGLGFHD